MANLSYEEAMYLIENGKLPERITGQLMFRETGKDVVTPGYDYEKEQEVKNQIKNSKRKLMMVFGVIAVPEEMDLKGEHQYVISGVKGMQTDMIGLTIHTYTAIDFTNNSNVRGSTPSGILQSPIWKV